MSVLASLVLALRLAVVFASPLAPRQSQPAPGCSVANFDGEFGLVAQYDSGSQAQLVLTGNGNDSSAVAWLGTRTSLADSDVLGVKFTMTNSGLTSTSGGSYTPRYDSQVFSNEFLGFESQKGNNESPDNIYCVQPANQTSATPLLELYDNAEGFYICDSSTSSKDQLVVYEPFPAGSPSYKSDTCQHAHILMDNTVETDGCHWALGGISTRGNIHNLYTCRLERSSSLLRHPISLTPAPSSHTVASQFPVASTSSLVVDDASAPVVVEAMDDFGVVYLIDNAQQFWSELDEILHIPLNATLSKLDSSLKRFVSFCASYHEQFLQSPLQLEYACDLLLDSELFTFHSERMCEIMTDEGGSNTDPHQQLILYNILLQYGRRNSAFLRTYKRWQPLVPLLMDHVLVDIDPDIDDVYSGSSTGPSTGWKGMSIPIEAMLRSLSVRLLYEVCRASKLSVQELRIFDDSFIEHLFDMVEQTRNMQDDTFNYSVIKLIVALNEQFMVAALKGPNAESTRQTNANQLGDNRVLQVLVTRLGLSQTFGENMIFMLNRASRSPEDLVMQLLVLKMLYMLFTTKGTCEYFYTNDLCVLVDVFLRELADLDEDAESLRHTYLRVLHPLLTKTQLRQTPYKRPQIVRALESLISNPDIREVTPTTKRLVERCLGGEWCLNLRKAVNEDLAAQENELLRTASPSNDRIAQQTVAGTIGAQLDKHVPLGRKKSLKGSRSVENVRGAAVPARKPSLRAPDAHRRPSNDSVLSLPAAATSTIPATAGRRERQGSVNLEQGHGKHGDHKYGDHFISPIRANSLGTAVDGIISPHHTASSFPNTSHHPSPTVIVVEPPVSPTSISSRMSSVGTPASTVSSFSIASLSSASTTSQPSSQTSKSTHRRSPPAPPKRRKPPAIPVPLAKYNGDTTITRIASSTSTPTLSSVPKKAAKY
ncbi:hypothetical protein EVG20_g431 [Dentipellis fragilis]|uniref:SPIN90/Ldb17 leucine-rich domain-containing protein n=1 Tax=Dentipellis fragilis TaxID=205917 RepID=A0A4Y9ZFA9_9AGAM|nr:hypothetical protein EVG20_g431 [Dentipellis fragilis]